MQQIYRLILCKPILNTIPLLLLTFLYYEQVFYPRHPSAFFVKL